MKRPGASAAEPPKRLVYVAGSTVKVCQLTGDRDRQARQPTLNRTATRAGLAAMVTVDSAGTGDWHLGERMHGPAEEELARRGYDGSAHRARQIQPSWLAGYDLLVAMDRKNLASLRRMAADAETAGRVRLLRSFDPALAAVHYHLGLLWTVRGWHQDAQEAFIRALDLDTTGEFAPFIERTMGGNP